MRVGLLIYGSLKGLSGGYLYDRKLVEHLTERGDDVKVYSMPFRSYSKHLVYNLSSYWLDRLSSERLDVLLQDELNHPSLFLLNRRLRTRVSYPIVSIVHHLRCKEQWPLPALALYRAVEWCYLLSVDAFIFNSRATCFSVEEFIGAAGSGVIAYPGRDRLGRAMDEKEITARVRREGPLELVFVGNLIPRKGLHDMLDGLAAVKDESWNLSVVGSSSMNLRYSSRIRGCIAALGLKDRVRLLGSLSDDELTSLLKKSDIVAMPFSYEGFGIIYLEGMAQGLPAFASSSGGAEEIVIHDENGYLVEPGDIDGFVSILLRLIKDREKLLRLSLYARRRFDSFPTWKQTGITIRNFLLKVASFNNKPKTDRP